MLEQPLPQHKSVPVREPLNMCHILQSWQCKTIRPGHCVTNLWLCSRQQFAESPKTASRVSLTGFIVQGQSNWFYYHLHNECTHPFIRSRPPHVPMESSVLDQSQK